MTAALSNWFLFTGLVLLVGSATALWLFSPKVEAGAASAEASAFIADRAVRTGRFAALGLVAALLAAAAVKFFEFRDPFATWQEDARFLIGSSWAGYWMAALATAILAAATFHVSISTRCDAPGRRAGIVVASFLTLILCAFPATTGHAMMETPAPRWLTVGGDALHLLAAGVWMGGLALMLICEWSWRRRRGAARRSLLPLTVPRFSPTALAAAAVLVLTGSFAAYLRLESPADLFGTTYGRLLAAKIVLVVAALGVGALNWRRLRPRLLAAWAEGSRDAAPARSALQRAAFAELLLAQLVIAVTAVLVRTSPPG
ncbi:MAG: CopD family protein [Gemmatimonadetes bacterium]|nr:CopD family protein [Gemmatimonadota bacterium]